MADVAAVFHWTPADMDQMPVTEILRWRDLAVERWNRMHAGPDSRPKP